MMYIVRWNVLGTFWAQWSSKNAEQAMMQRESSFFETLIGDFHLPVAGIGVQGWENLGITKSVDGFMQ